MSEMTSPSFQAEGSILLPAKKSTDYSTKCYSGLIRSPQLSPAELRCYLTILTFRNCKEIFVKQQTIADKMGAGLRSVSRHIAVLSDMGLLKKISRPGYTSLLSVLDYRELCDIKGINPENGFVFALNDIITSDKLTDNELRFYLTIKSLAGYDNITPSMEQLSKYCNLSKPTMRNVRDSTANKGLVKYEVRGNVVDGLLPHQYYISDEEQWLIDQSK